MRGKFIAFEGPDGSGKSTVLEKVKEYLDKNNIDYVFTREPGGTPIGEKIRDILLHFDTDDMDDKTEVLLFAAARAQNVEENIKKALDDNRLVISDRFVLSSIAYQGYARGIGVDEVRQINDFATSHLKPDYTFFLDVDPITVLKRKKKSVNPDRLEKETNTFHERVYEGYKSLIDEGKDEYIIIDASLPVEDVINNTIEELKKILEA